MSYNSEICTPFYFIIAFLCQYSNPVHYSTEAESSRRITHSRSLILDNELDLYNIIEHSQFTLALTFTFTFAIHVYIHVRIHVHIHVCIHVCIHVRFQEEMAPSPFTAALATADVLGWG